MALRARIVLACAAGGTNAGVAQQLEISRETVRKWRDRFATHRLAGLTDEPRSGAPRRIGDDVVRRVVTATLEWPAPTGGRWTTRSLAASMGLSQTAVSRIWREHGLRPDRVRAWRLVTDPEFVARVQGVAGVHLAGRGSALVLAADPAATPNAGPGPALPPAVVSTVDPATTDGPGRADDLLGFLAEVEATASAGTLHVLFADEPALHVRPVRDWLTRHRHVECHAIPACAPWSVLADRWLAVPGGAAAPGTTELRARIHRWSTESGHNRPMPTEPSRQDRSW